MEQKKVGEILEIGQFKFDGGLLFFDEVSRQFRSLSSQLSKNSI